MRSIVLIILMAIAFSWADETPPPPRVMCIYMKDGTIDSIPCSRVDPGEGITFLDNGMKMKVGLADLVNPDFGVWVTSIRWYCTNIIDSITFPFLGPPPEPELEPQPESAPQPNLRVPR